MPAMPSLSRRLIVSGLCALCAVPALADDDMFTFHGFGNQDAAKTSNNTFEQAGPSTTWEDNFLGLVASAKISDQSKLWVQLQDNSVEEARVTWMFVDYQVNNDLSFQVGRVKFPYGIYNEYIDTRALQETVGKPLAYSLEADLVYDSYNGIGVNWSHDLPNNWGRFTAQGFTGDIFSPNAPYVTVAYPNQFQMQNLESFTVDHHIIGTKLTWETPVDGLRLLLSANENKVVSMAVNGQIPNEQDTEVRWIASVDYVTDRVDLKAEYNHHKYPGQDGFADEISHAWYVQAGFPIGKWTPYTQYNSVVTDSDLSSNPSYFQNTLVLGINRKLTQNLNFRIEDDFNHGYALPVASGETLTNAGKVNWQLYQAQINFLF
jgi:hypothetical protein